MSKPYNSYTPDSVTRAIIHMSVEEIVDQYGIEVSEDGGVWDGCEGRNFATLAEWALFMDECEEAAFEAATCKGNTRYCFDDD